MLRIREHGRTRQSLQLFRDHRVDGLRALYRHLARQPHQEAGRAGDLPDVGLSALHRTGETDRRHSADLRRGLRRLLQSPAARTDPHRHRGRCGHARARPCAGGTSARSLRQHRRGRDSRSRRAGTGAGVMMEQLPALQVVLPLIAAPLVVLLRRPNIAWFVAVAASWASLAIALLLFDHVGQHGVISYAMGSWPAPWGIEYRVDRLNAFVLVLVAGLAAIVAPYSLRSSAAEVPAEQLYLYYALYLLCLAGLLGIVITGDAFNLFVFMEISSLSMYVLIALGRSRRAQLAAYQYLIMGTLG